ncbi:MAG: PIN domain-containing protein [Propionicimonas sp.]|nr:PIN domain-containing protein [Propionicimonas sp.]
MGFPALLDTNALYAAVLADTLLRIAEEGAYRPHWSPDILDELRRNLMENAGISEAQAAHRIDQMEQAFPDASVTGYAGLIDGLRCDPKDRHVLAAAIHGQCQVIVTFNTKDFPPESVDELGIAVVHPQDFLLDRASICN